MFSKKVGGVTTVEYLMGRVEKLEKAKTSPPKECETCGCLIGYRAVKGEGEIRQRDKRGIVGTVGGHGIYGNAGIEDYVYYPYYCKIHAPQVEENDETMG